MPVPSISRRDSLVPALGCRALVALGLLALLGACGPKPEESPPIQRGTALPPPGLVQPPAR